MTKRAKIPVAEPDSLFNPDAKEERVKSMHADADTRAMLKVKESVF